VDSYSGTPEDIKRNISSHSAESRRKIMFVLYTQLPAGQKFPRFSRNYDVQEISPALFLNLSKHHAYSRV
jgi:hypothetical protein